jgi:hypothetical protein
VVPASGVSGRDLAERVSRDVEDVERLPHAAVITPVVDVLADEVGPGGVWCGEQQEVAAAVHLLVVEGQRGLAVGDFGADAQLVQPTSDGSFGTRVCGLARNEDVERVVGGRHLLVSSLAMPSQLVKP